MLFEQKYPLPQETLPKKEKLEYVDGKLKKKQKDSHVELNPKIEGEK